mgnify:CR=1 FL=1
MLDGRLNRRNTCVALLTACLLMGAIAAYAEIIAPQSRPWRVGICGGWTVGYLGVLAHHGMPAERILEEEILDRKRLAQYDCIIVGQRRQRDYEAWRPLEEYVRQGGTLLTEVQPVPTNAAIPGKRLAPGRLPNVRFESSLSPIVEGLDFNRVIVMASRAGAAIIPDGDSGTTVLARCTYDGIDAKTRERVDDHFLDEEGGKHPGRGAPVLLMRHLDRGILVWSGCPIGYSLSLQGDQFAPILINLLQYLSKGEIHSRFHTGAMPRERLLTANLDAFAPVAEATEATASPPAASAPPPVYQTLESDLAADEDFWIYGTLEPEEQAAVLLGYTGEADAVRLSLAGDRMTLERVEGGKSSLVASAILHQPVRSGNELLMRKRGQLLICYLDGKRVLSACPSVSLAGSVLCHGLGECGVQPSAEVYFADDFMREEGSSSDWETVSGRWTDVVTTGAADKGANPFKYMGTSDRRAIATTGYWFWQDYAAEVSVQATSAAGSGLLFYYQDVDNYYLLRLSHSRDSSEALVELLRRSQGQNEILAQAPVNTIYGQWCKLGVRASGDMLVAQVDGVPVLQSTDAYSGHGAVGLYAEGGAAIFDDVAVRPWQAIYSSDRDVTALWHKSSDQWEQLADGTISGNGKALLPYKSQADSYMSVPVKVGAAQAAGVYMRYSGESKLYLAALVRQNPTMVLRLYCADGKRDEVLAEVPVAGSPDSWHEIGFTARGALLTVALDGRPAIQLADAGPQIGGVGLYARGNVPAQFRAPKAHALVETAAMVDQFTPDFAGIIDRHTWAGRPGAWHPEHAELNRFWHSGYFPGPVALLAGVHPLGEEHTATHLYLSERDRPTAGYEVIAERVWAQGQLLVRLLRQGTEVERASVAVHPDKPYLLSLHREGGSIWAEVDGQAAVAINGEPGNPALCHLGVSNGGQKLVAEDLAVYSPWARNYTFMDAPTDWVEHTGTWEVTNRWSCSPQWTWFCGYNGSGPAEVSSKLEVAGDMELSFYVAPRMMPTPDGKTYEQLRDVHIGICGGANGAADGYLIKVGDNRNRLTTIERKGIEVRRSSFTLPQLAIHNDWTQLGVRKRGATIQLLYWGHVVMEYTDPEPLESGRVSLGTDNNGIIIPRLTVYGHIVTPPTDPLGLPAG